MPLGHVERGGLVEQVLGQMRELIAAGEWPVGERIPSEPVLATQLSVGRSTVREAVRALVHTGVLTVRQGDGTRVVARTELSGLVRRRLEAAEQAHVVEVRRALEVEAARLAAERRRPADLRRIERALRLREDAWTAGDVAAWVEADTRFHIAVVQAARNPVLLQLYEDFAETLRASIASWVGDELTDRSHIDHAALVDAIRDGDPRRATAEAGCLLSRLPGQA